MTCNRPDVLCKLEFIDKFKVVVPFHIFMQMLANSQWEFQCNLLSFESYTDIGTTYLLNMKACLVYLWNKSRNKTSNK